MSRLICKAVVFLMLVATGRLHAQYLPPIHYTIADGLPSNNIYSVYRDSKGFLWLASDKGIARYNGLRFETFTTNSGLPDNEIFFFKEDPFGRIWLGTYNGELCYYKDGIFHTAANTPFLRMPYPVPHITNIGVAPDSSVVINFYNVLYLANVVGESLKVYKFPIQSPSTKDSVIHGAYYKRKIGKGAFELLCYDKTVIIDTAYKVLKTTVGGLPLKTIYLQSQNGGWLTNDTALYTTDLKVIRRDRDTAERSLTTYNIHDYYTDGTNWLLAGATGLLINESVKLLVGHNISSVTQDQYGNYWVSTLDDGVYCYHKDFLQTSTLVGAYAGEMKCAETLGGRIYFTTLDNSLSEIRDGIAQRIVNFGSLDNVDHVPSKDGTSLIDVKNSIYYCFMRFHTVVYNWKARQLKMRKMEVQLNGAKDVFVQDGNAYVKGTSTISRVSMAALQGEQVVETDRIVKEDLTRIYAMAQAPDSSIWYATMTGMYRIEHGNKILDGRFAKYPLKQLLFIGKYLVGYTHNNFLLVFDYQAQGMTVDTVKGQDCVWDKLYPIDSTHLLISTNNLYRLLTIYTPVSSNGFTVVPVENSFIPVQAEYVCADSQRCYFFRKGDITVVPKHTIFAVPAVPKLYFTTVRSGGKTYRIGDASDKTLEIPYGESRSIIISFARLVAKGQSIIQQYSISKNGDNDAWQEVKGEELNLLNPGYGDYTIKVRARTLSSSYGAPVMFMLHINRPFWATWWFLLLVAACAVALVVTGVRLRVRYMVLKNEKQHRENVKFIKSEYKALNALMNPHFVFNTLNNVQGLVNRNDKLAANEYIRVFADLIRQNMHNLSKELIPLQKEMELVVNYLLLEKLRFKDLLNYSIDVEESLDLSEIFVPPLLVQPLVENSIKHGILPLESVEGRVVIRIYEKSAHLLIEVRDNGVGLAKAMEGRAEETYESFAMTNIKRRIEQLSIILNKQITLDMNEVKEHGDARQWTVVTVSIPV